MQESSRTKLDFNFSGKADKVIEKWAAENSFVVRQVADDTIECQRGGGVLMCPVLVQIRQNGAQVHFKTWLQVDLLTEFTTLFNAPAQSAIHSGEKLLWHEKEIARLYVNKLLKEFKQAPIP
jgi:hypothetical protein